MRVIGGTCRGRALRAPAGTATRPTSDRVREAIFDVLGSMDAVEGSRVLDLFAGSGAMGIEALSRGAGRAVFVDDAPAALAVVRANLATLGLEPQATVVRADVLSWLARTRGVGDDVGEGDGAQLAFCDPPYDFDRWEVLLERLDTDVAVLESSRPVEVPPPWEVLRHKRYGGTLVTVASRVRSSPNPQVREKGSP